MNILHLKIFSKVEKLIYGIVFFFFLWIIKMNNRWLNSCLLTTIRWAWTGRWQVSCRLEKNCVQWDSATHVSHCTSKNPNEWLWTHMLSQFIDSPYHIYIYIFIYIDPFPHTSSSLYVQRVLSWEANNQLSFFLPKKVRENARKLKKEELKKTRQGSFLCDS